MVEQERTKPGEADHLLARILIQIENSPVRLHALSIARTTWAPELCINALIRR